MKTIVCHLIFVFDCCLVRTSIHFSEKLAKLMGNEKSALSGLKIDDKPVEITDFWSHYMACVNGYNTQRISVFVSEPSLHYNANFGNPSPLEKCTKVNLLIILYIVESCEYMCHSIGLDFFLLGSYCFS